MSIVKDSVALRNVIHTRLKKLYPSNSKIGFKQADVIKDASERGFTISAPSMSKYFAGDVKNGLSEAQILWLAIRYGIPIKLTIGNPYIGEDNTLKYEIPEFNEAEALKLLKLIFPQKAVHELL
jgi:hypothetical protein